MRRTRLVVLLLAATTALTGCGDIPLDELGLSPEDQEALEEALEDFAEAANDAQNGSDGDSDRPQDPDWSPPGMPPPPGAPSESEDRSDSPSCPSGWACGEATYHDDDGQAARDHYEEIFGRPPDTEYEYDDIYGEATSSSWNDGDVKVQVDTLRDDGREDRTYVTVHSEPSVLD